MGELDPNFLAHFTHFLRELSQIPELLISVIFLGSLLSAGIYVRITGAPWIYRRKKRKNNDA
jgi:hypothetical protein